MKISRDYFEREHSDCGLPWLLKRLEKGDETGQRKIANDDFAYSRKSARKIFNVQWSTKCMFVSLKHEENSLLKLMRYVHITVIVRFVYGTEN